MFARKVSFHLKVNSHNELKRKLDTEIIPLMRKQKGFLDEITFLHFTGKEAHTFSLWESAEHAEAYNREIYPQVTKILAAAIEGSPRVQTYEIFHSTFLKILVGTPA